MPDPATLAALREVPWKTILGLLSIYVCSCSLFTTYILYGIYNSFWTAFLISASTSLLFTFRLYWSPTFRCCLVISVIMCFTKVGLGLVYIFVSWMIISGRLFILISSFMEVENHSICIAGLQNVTLVSEDLNWHISQIQLTSNIIHYGFFIPILLLIIYSFTFVFCYRSAVDTSTSPERNKKVNFIKSLILVVRKGGQLVLGFTLGFTVCIIYFGGLSSMLSSLESKYKSVVCAISFVPTTWTVMYVYLGIGLAFQVLSYFSEYARKYRDATVKQYFPEKETANRPVVVVQKVGAPTSKTAPISSIASTSVITPVSRSTGQINNFPLNDMDIFD